MEKRKQRECLHDSSNHTTHTAVLPLSQDLMTWWASGHQKFQPRLSILLNEVGHVKTPSKALTHTECPIPGNQTLKAFQHAGWEHWESPEAPCNWRGYQHPPKRHEPPRTPRTSR